MEEIPMFFIKAMTKQIAQSVELCAEITRQYGFKFPAKYELGVKVGKARGRNIPVRVRVGDVHVEGAAFLPAMGEDAQGEWMAQLARLSNDVVVLYMNTHKELSATSDEVDDLIKRVAAMSDAEIWSRAQAKAMSASYQEAT